MTIPYSFKSALQAWEAGYSDSEALWPHPGDSELELSVHLNPRKRREIVEHIARCVLCTERYRERQIAQAVMMVQAWGVISRKAADGEVKTYPMVVYSDNSQYKIEILQSTGGGVSGLVVLSITDLKMAEQAEGQEYIICDARGRTILRGFISKGQVWQKLIDINEIDDRHFLVRPLPPKDTKERNE